MNDWYFYGCIVGCFSIRALPRLVVPYAINSDTYFHLYCAQVYRDAKFRIPLRLPRIVLPHWVTYPPLYHFVLALFSLRGRLWAERLTGAVLDTVNLLVLYAYALWLGREFNVRQYEWVAVWAAALYAFSPALLRLSGGPRPYNGSPRVVGQTLYLFHLVLAHYALATGSILAGIISATCGGLLLLSAKFGVQVLAFFGILMTLLVSPLYVLLLVAAGFIALLISKGHVLHVIGGQIQHSIFYFKHLQSIFLFPTVKRLQRSGFSRWLYCGKHCFQALVQGSPYFLLAVLSYPQTQGGENRFLFIWMMAGLICFFLTSYRPLMFLGQPERYLEYAIVPAILLTVEGYLQTAPAVLTCLLIYSLGSALYRIRKTVRHFRPIQQQHIEGEQLCKMLNALPHGNLLPIGSLHWQALYQTTHQIVTHGCNFDERVLSPAEFMLVCGRYPFPSSDLDKIIAQFDVDYVLTSRSALQFYQEKILANDALFEARFEPLYEQGDMLVLKAKECAAISHAA